MQSTIIPATRRKVSAVKEVSQNKRSHTQLKRGKEPVAVNKTGNSVRPQQRRSVHASVGTTGFNTAGLSFEVKSAYHMLKDMGASIDFTLDQKIRALMTYRCIRHIPGFVDKQFSNVSDAVAYVYQATTQLIGDSDYGFIGIDSAYDGFKDIPQHYSMQIIYETFPEGGIWQSYGPINTLKDKKLRSALMMCLSLVKRFGFQLLDSNCNDEYMDLDDWAQWRIDSIEESIEYNYDQFKERYGVKYNPKKHKDSMKYPIVDDIENDKKMIDVVYDLIAEYKDIVYPFQQEVRDIKVSLRYIQSVINSCDSESHVADWMKHILFLNKIHFDLHRFIAEAYMYDSEASDNYYEDSISPISANGFVYDNQSDYASDMLEAFNDRANSYTVIPICLNEVINPDKGYIYRSPDQPIGEWINKIFDFNFNQMMYL